MESDLHDKQGDFPSNEVHFGSMSDNVCTKMGLALASSALSVILSLGWRLLCLPETGASGGHCSYYAKLAN